MKKWLIIMWCLINILIEFKQFNQKCLVDFNTYQIIREMK